ncbi:MAG TPA: response regulator [Polyangiaceae bacterium]
MRDDSFNESDYVGQSPSAFVRAEDFDGSTMRGATEPHAVVSNVGATVRARPLSGIRLLVVDDDPDTRDLLESILITAGASVVMAPNVAEALQQLALEQPDLILSDIGMPECDGHDLIRRVRNLPAAHGGAVPAIALSAFCQASDRRKSLEAGFSMHLAKPFDLDELIRSISHLHARALGRE